MTAERVAIIGGGIGALATALALKHSERRITILERDAAPPEITAAQAFELWERPGVPQFRHAHIFLARLQTLLRDHHPELWRELQQAGIELSSLPDAFPQAHLPSLRPMPDDADLQHLWGRRPTFEYVVRRHVERLPNVTFIHDAKVEGLSSEQRGSGVQVCGVHYTRAGARHTLDAELVVDASGKRTRTPEWLREKGVRVESEQRPSGFVYACRHYRLRDPRTAPPRRDGGGNLDYLGYATFHSEHGSFALTFGCPTYEQELAELMRRTEGFDALCQCFPVLERWTALAEPQTKVLGAGRFENRWTRYGVRGGLELAGFFPVGDSYIETNPMYGRGCTFAFVEAQVLAQALDESQDPRRRAARYYGRTRELLRPYFDISVGTDRIYHARARLRRGEPVAPGERLLNYFYESAWMRANEKSLLVAREFVKAQQMREVSSAGLRLRMILHILRAWLGGALGRAKGKAALIPPRREFLRGLPAPSPGRGER